MSEVSESMLKDLTRRGAVFRIGLEDVGLKPTFAAAVVLKGLTLLLLLATASNSFRLLEEDVPQSSLGGEDPGVPPGELPSTPLSGA